eukprot:Gb_15839 [translate_table: standard]
MISSTEEKESQVPSKPEVIKATKKKKEEGTTLFMAKHIEQYGKATKYIEHNISFKNKWKKKLKALTMPCNWINITCNLKLKDNLEEQLNTRGVLYRDGSVLMSVSLDQLKTSELLYKSLATKLIVGMPFKDLATMDTILLRELPPVDDNEEINSTKNFPISNYQTPRQKYYESIYKTGKKDADDCFDIKNTLVQKEYNIPLVAKIHFSPLVTMRETEEDYQKELKHIEEVFGPLVEKFKKYGRAMHIATNHGSLSNRIMSDYGDSPRGMVESTFEFARICQRLDFHNFVSSMKSSNPIVMVQAYHLLIAERYVQGWDYPLHLGVTEVGEGEDAQMKSAIGIGTLLQDGSGDTIRFSLIEPPEEEIDPCRRLSNLGMQATKLQKGVAPLEEKHCYYFDFQCRTGQLLVQKEGEEVDYRGVLLQNSRELDDYGRLSETLSSLGKSRNSKTTSVVSKIKIQGDEKTAMIVLKKKGHKMEEHPCHHRMT